MLFIQVGDIKNVLDALLLNYDYQSTHFFAKNRIVRSIEDIQEMNTTNARMEVERLTDNIDGRRIYDLQAFAAMLSGVRQGKIPIHSYDLVKSHSQRSYMINADQLYMQQMALKRLDLIAAWARKFQSGEKVYHNGKLVSSTSIQMRAELMLDTLCEVKGGAQLAYRWCQKNASIIKVPTSIIIRGILAERSAGMNFKGVCAQQHKEFKRKL